MMKVIGIFTLAVISHLQISTVECSKKIPTQTLNLVTLGDHKYYISDFTVTWFDAAFFCEINGMSLVKIEDANENNLIMNHANLSKQQVFYTSGTIMGHSNNWYWGDGTPMNYTNWYPGEPNNLGGSEMCLIIRTESTGFPGWNDVDCAPSASKKEFWGHAFICEELVSKT